MDTPAQRLILAWTIFFIGILANATASQTFGWPWWIGTLVALVLGVGLAAAGLRLIPIG